MLTCQAPPNSLRSYSLKLSPICPSQVFPVFMPSYKQHLRPSSTAAVFSPVPLELFNTCVATAGPVIVSISLFTNCLLCLSLKEEGIDLGGQRYCKWLLMHIPCTVLVRSEES